MFDGRGVIARRFKDIAGAILADQAGADQCSEARKQLIRRFAAAAVLASNWKAALPTVNRSISPSTPRLAPR